MYDMWNFINEKLTDDGQTMKVDTIYKNFMGIDGSRIMVNPSHGTDIFTLSRSEANTCHRIIKGRLASSMIDYTNIADVEFSAKILDSLSEIQKLANQRIGGFKTVCGEVARDRNSDNLR